MSAPSASRPDVRDPGAHATRSIADADPATGRPDLRHLLAGAFGIYAVLTVAFTLLGWGLLSIDGLERSDRRSTEWIVDRRTSSLDDWSWWGSMLSETAVKIVVTAIACGVVIWLFRHWREPLMLAVPLVVEASVFITVTAIVGRPRPDVPQLDESPVSSSYPSGHVAAAVVYGAIVIVLAWRTRRTWIPILAAVLVAAIVGAVGWARWYRGMHYVSDVIVGVVLGIVSVVACWALLRRIVPAPEHADASRPTAQATGTA